MGYIYKITNEINQKVYIGKTLTSLEKRWKRHIYDTYRSDRTNYQKNLVLLRKRVTKNRRAVPGLQ